MEDEELNDQIEEEFEEEEMDDDLPIFASKENRQLNAVVKELEARTETITHDLKDKQGRVTIMREHLSNVRQEHDMVQQLFTQKQAELEAEDHLKSLADRNAGKLKKDIESSESRCEDISEKINVIQNGVYATNEKLDNLKQGLNWSQEELEQWATATKQKEDDQMALEKYTRADESRVSELNLECEKLTTEAAKLEEELETEMTATRALQIEINRIAEDFREKHAHRQNCIRQWQTTLAKMAQRDSEIAQVGQEFDRQQSVVEIKKEEVKEQQRRLEQIVKDNKEANSHLLSLERILARQREELKYSAANLQQFKDETEVIRNQLAKVASDLNTYRFKRSTTEKRLIEKRAELAQSISRREEVRKRLKAMQEDKGQAEMSCSQAEEEVKRCEQDLILTDKAVMSLKKDIFRASQELFRLRKIEANFVAEIAGAQAASKNLSATISEHDRTSSRQQELLYDAEFNIQQLQRKVSRASGERTDEERKALTAKIATLTKQLENQQSQRHMLNTQVKKLEDEYRQAQRKAGEWKERCLVLADSISEMKLRNGTSSTELRKVQAARDESVVAHDVLKLEAERLKDTLSSKTDEVHGLENRKFQLAMSMEERRKEIAVHKDVQRAQVKMLEEQTHKYMLEFRDREQKVDKLKLKYETLVAASGLGSGENGETSQAYFIIQAAQKREEMQREGDELDAKVQTAEKELRALEHTLKHLNVRNQRYRGSFAKADPGSMDVSKLKQLEASHKVASDSVFRLKKELQRVERDQEEDNRRLKQLDASTETLRETVDHLTLARRQAESELSEQKSRLEEAYEAVQSASEEHRRSRVPEEGEEEEEGETVDEKAFRMQGVRDTNQNVLFTLGQVVKEYPEMGNTLDQLLSEAQLELPSLPVEEDLLNEQ